jgi:NDP-sugar pyrophosphorylase family protein
MKIIVPMAGTGDRFVKAGYRDPKPMIKVNGKRILEYIYDMFDPTSDEFVFICNSKHLNETDMRSYLNTLSPGCHIVEIENHKKGPVYTVSKVFDEIEDDKEVIVSYCDNPYLWNYDDFKNFVKTTKSDGCVLSHIGPHPHRLNSTFMAHITNDGLKLLTVKEKESYTNNPIMEQVSTGTYYFGKGSLVKKYFQELMDLDINYNGEYYVTLVYNLLVRDRLNVTIYPTDLVTFFGTPEEVQNFEAWQTLLKGHQVRSEKELLICYNYWKQYNEKSNPQKKQ